MDLFAAEETKFQDADRSVLNPIAGMPDALSDRPAHCGEHALCGQRCDFTARCKS